VWGRARRTASLTAAGCPRGYPQQQTGQDLVGSPAVGLQAAWPNWLPPLCPSSSHLLQPPLHMENGKMGIPNCCVQGKFSKLSLCLLWLQEPLGARDTTSRAASPEVVPPPSVSHFLAARPEPTLPTRRWQALGWPRWL
jgi:hypothetical protein